jgi:pimeloyl-ACP methyl ester carboxylesterase
MNIVFVPGLNCTAALFKPQIEALAGRAACTVADHALADDLAAIAGSILDHAPDQFALVGLSMGGYVAYEIMRQQPERVTHLVLLDTRAQPDTEEDAERRRLTLALAREGRFEHLHGILWPRLVHPERLKDGALEKIVVGMMRETGAEGFIRQQTAVLNRVDYRPQLAAISVPTLVAVGAQDAITPPAHSREIVDLIKGSTFCEIANCGHLSSLEKPQEVSRLLADFLN